MDYLALLILGMRGLPNESKRRFDSFGFSARPTIPLVWNPGYHLPS
jgi:hypothetical protein